MSERFTETLRAASEAGWSHAVQHRSVNELFAGAVPDAVMARYLIQDHRFFDSFRVLRRRPSIAVIRTQRRVESGRLSATARGGIAPFSDPDGSRGCATGVFGFPALKPLH